MSHFLTITMSEREFELIIRSLESCCRCLDSYDLIEEIVYTISNLHEERIKHEAKRNAQCGNAFSLGNYENQNLEE